MTRSLGLVLLVLTLAVGGLLAAQQSKTVAPGGAAQQAETQADQAASAASFAGVEPVLQLWFEEHGTYAGVTLPVHGGVVVATAGASSYCLEAVGMHLDGPGGSPVAGSC